MGAGWYWGTAAYAVLASVALLSPDLWYTAALLPCVLVPPLVVLQQALRTAGSPREGLTVGALVVRVAALLLALPLVLFSVVTVFSGSEEMLWAHGENVLPYLPLALGLPLLLLLDPPSPESPLGARRWAAARWAAAGVYLLVLATAFVYHRDEVEGFYALDWRARLLWMGALGVCAVLTVFVSVPVSARVGGAPAVVAVPAVLAAVTGGATGVLAFLYGEPESVWLTYEAPVPQAVLVAATLTAGALVAAAVSRAAGD